MAVEEQAPSAACVHSAADDLPRAYGATAAAGVIRAAPEDFQVDEIIPMEPDGAGEHCLLQIEKRNSNTDWVAGLLARHAGVPRRDVSYAGMKDRNAVTRQWFSVRLAGRAEPDWRDLESADLRLLQIARHGRKLRTGALLGNRFRLRVTGLQADRHWLQQRLQRIRQRGVPNYFGEQRFGHRGANLQQARRMLEGGGRRIGRHKQGIYLSAARSLLFNRVLASRIGVATWDQPEPGDWMALAGSRSGFKLDGPADETILRRCREMDIQPTGPLWGLGEPLVSDGVLQLESACLAPCRLWCEGLERHGLKQERRPLRVPAGDLSWEIGEGEMTLSFSLPKGSYATALLRELIDYRVAGAGRE